MSLLRATTLFCTLLCSAQYSFAQMESDTATVQSGPTFEITSGPIEEGPDSASVMPLMPLTNNGSWANSAAGPTIYSKNWSYYLQLNPVGVIPPTATIQSVYYSWGLSYKPTGLSVLLCQNSISDPCVDVTNFQSGSTTGFNGRLANKKLIYSFRINGSGTLSPPAYGQVDQVIVNYQY